jgi:hypothetical protein
MKKIISAILISASLISAGAQSSNTSQSQNKPQGGNTVQTKRMTATLKASSRLFENRDDLTSVILVIPAGSVVEVIGSDSTYLKVIFDNTEGFMYRKHATIDKVPAEIKPELQQNNPPQDQPADRLSYLQKKYGPEMAARLYAGKIWKGMTSQMVQDSWGTPLQVNSSVNTNPVRYEWVYKSSSLYIENNTLVDWGPVRK